MGSEGGENFPLRYSLFPHVPPYIRILPPGREYSPPLPPELAQFTWLAPAAISPIIENCVAQSGFILVKQGGIRRKEADLTGAIWDCLPITEKAKDEINFAGLNEEVKINQFPGLFIIGRKDNLWLSFVQMRNKFGAEHFDFCPTTYILPTDTDILTSRMSEERRAWIVKPPNWYCGIGITLIDDIKDLPKRKNLFCVQEYIDRPLLIKGLKFDLRLYVLLTSIDPVRVYVYEEGLVRFATKPYSNSPEEIKNLFIHLTNFSINKNNDEFAYNETPGGHEGHKWNLGALWTWFETQLKIDWRPIWENIKDICTKTIICGQEHMRREFRKNIKSDYNCYKLFGLDVFIDSDLKPWIIEVNNIPSLHVNTVDTFVNAPMVAEMFNIVGFHIPKQIGYKSQKVVSEKLSLRLPSGALGHDYRVYSRLKTQRDTEKQSEFSGGNFARDDASADAILKDLTPSDIRTLIHSEEELSQCCQWTRCIPSHKVNYLQFLSGPGYSDRLLDSWERKFGATPHDREVGRDLLRDHCREREHLQLPEVVVPLTLPGLDPVQSAGMTSPAPRTNSNGATLSFVNLSDLKAKILDHACPPVK